MKRDARQPDLFAPRPRNFDEAALIKRLEAATRSGMLLDGGLSPAERRRLRTPLPRVTAWD